MLEVLVVILGSVLALVGSFAMVGWQRAGLAEGEVLRRRAHRRGLDTLVTKDARPAPRVAVVTRR